MIDMLIDSRGRRGFGAEGAAQIRVALGHNLPVRIGRVRHLEIVRQREDVPRRLWSVRDGAAVDFGAANSLLVWLWAAPGSLGHSECGDGEESWDRAANHIVLLKWRCVVSSNSYRLLNWIRGCLEVSKAYSCRDAGA